MLSDRRREDDMRSPSWLMTLYISDCSQNDLNNASSESCRLPDSLEPAGAVCNDAAPSNAAACEEAPHATDATPTPARLLQARQSSWISRLLPATYAPLHRAVKSAARAPPGAKHRQDKHCDDLLRVFRHGEAQDPPPPPHLRPPSTALCCLPQPLLRRAASQRVRN